MQKNMEGGESRTQVEALVEDEFQKAYEATRHERYSEAESYILDENGDARPIFDHNLNHAWYTVGDIRYKKGDFKGAKNAFSKSVEYDMEDFDAWLALGNALTDFGDFREAEACFRIMVRFSSNADVARFNLAGVLMDQEEYKAAEEILSRLPQSESVERNLSICRQELAT